MNRSEFDVEKLVSLIGSGELRLPELQRRYVWRAPRVRDLFDSLYRGYPSGTILMWETSQEQPTRDLAVKQDSSPFSGHKLLLDGQQRLTSLYAVLRGEPVHVRGRQKPISLLFNLDHPDLIEEYTEVESDEDTPIAEDRETEEESDIEISMGERVSKMTFVIESRALAQHPNWIKVTDVFKSSSDAEILKKAGITSMDDPRFSKFTARLQRIRAIRKYSYTVQILPTNLDYEEVAEIFVRVNSLGVKLRGSDLALAQITARWPNSLALLEEFQEECEEHWMTLDLGLLVRAMVVFATGQSKFKTVSSIQTKKLKEGWEQAKEGIRYAINFLRINADIEDESLLSSPLFFISIAYYSYIHNGKLLKDEEKKLLFWLYIANARGRYSRGSSESMLDADLNTISRKGNPNDLIETVKQQFGRIHIESSDFINRGAGSPLFSLVFLALKANGAKDWHSGLELSLTHSGRYHYIQFHHIFPRSLIKDLYERQEVNEIANFAFISGKTNKKLSNRKPSDYIPEVINERGEDAFLTQCVPLEKELHSIPNYKKFLERRRQLLTDTVNDFIQNAVRD